MLQDIFLSSSLMRVADVSVQLGPGATRCDRSRNKFDAKLLMSEIRNTQLRRAKTLTAISRGMIKQFLNLPII